MSVKEISMLKNSALILILQMVNQFYMCVLGALFIGFGSMEQHIEHITISSLISMGLSNDWK